MTSDSLADGNLEHEGKELLAEMKQQQQQAQGEPEIDRRQDPAAQEQDGLDSALDLTHVASAPTKNVANLGHCG